MRVVGLVSRTLTNYELGRPPLERKLHLIRWALYRCRRFTTTAPEVQIHLAEPEHVIALLDRTSHLRLQALLVDLASYRAVYR